MYTVFNNCVIYVSGHTDAITRCLLFCIIRQALCFKINYINTNIEEKRTKFQKNLATFSWSLVGKEFSNLTHLNLWLVILKGIRYQKIKVNYDMMSHMCQTQVKMRLAIKLGFHLYWNAVNKPSKLTDKWFGIPS